MPKLYARLAKINLKNGKQFYLPFWLMGMVSTILLYTMISINNNEGLKEIPGSDSMKSILGFGTAVIIFFISIFLFYTNSFIMKRRKKELGVYNILGMEKKHIVRVLFLETLFSYIVSVGVGLVIGIVFNKLLTMLLYKIIGTSVPIKFYVSTLGMSGCVVIFAIIFFMTFIYNMMQVRLANPIELLHGSNAGEKEPKTKIIMTILGAICLGAGYYMALTTENPLDALSLFFIAVMLVIAGTYLLFTAGSIALLKLLRKNKSYYYKPKHFTAVSGMLYRMKQNAVGLANICILSTMVLVMMSTTFSMYIGIDDELRARFPHNINTTADSDTLRNTTELRTQMERVVAAHGLTLKNEVSSQSFEMTVMMDGDTISGPPTDVTDENIHQISIFEFMTRDDYQSMTEEKVEDIEANQVILIGNPDYQKDSIDFFGQTYQVLDSDLEVSAEDEYMAGMVNTYYYVLVDNAEVLDSIYQLQKQTLGDNAGTYETSVGMDIDGSRTDQKVVEAAVAEAVKQWSEGEGAGQYTNVYTELRETNREDIQALYGGLFFLGLFLGIMFLMVTVLIIFYKQISEGYDDKERFAIMEKVGMSNKEVKATISSQIRTVFILPIAAATVHVIAAYPMIEKMLSLLNLSNVVLFRWCLVGTVAIFFVIYLIVFLITSKSYYQIVGNQVK